MPDDSAVACLAVSRPTADVDIVLHIETGAATTSSVTGGTQALRRTVNCRVAADKGDHVLISIPNALGALVLKGAAYLEDSRDAGRHLDDAAVLLATITSPLSLVADMKGSDRSRVLALNRALSDAGHESWKVLDITDRAKGASNLAVLCSNPDRLPPRRLGT